MIAENITKAVYQRLVQEGWKGKIVSIEHLPDLHKEIEALHQNGLLDESLYTEELAAFDFNLTTNFSDSKTLIVVSAPQPLRRIVFSWQGRRYPCIIPPTYSYATDYRVKETLEKLLNPKGYHLEKKRLPAKMLAVRSGLARYGKNNITYVPAIGSFHRLVVFVSDLPRSEDNWGEAKILKSCDGCTACMDACPAGAITPDRFLLHAQRCITFHNERHGKFPFWLNPAWHNCLVGCMYCQNACPMNQKHTNWVEDGIFFDAHETALLIQGAPKEDIPDKTASKLESYDMMDYIDILGRNLKALTENHVL